MKRVVAPLALMVALLLGATVRAQSAARMWSTQGGELVPVKNNAVSFSTGYPNAMAARYHLPLAKRLEILPSFAFYYGRATKAPMVGNLITSLIKFRLVDGSKFDLSVAAEPGFGLNYYPGKFGFAISLGLPQVLATYRIQKEFALHFGYKMPIIMMVHPAFVAGIPILVNFGFEYLVAKDFTIFASMDMGAEIYAAEDGSSAKFYPSFAMGGAYKF